MLGTNDLKAALGMIPEEIAWGAEKLLRCIAGAECGPGGAAPKVLLISPSWVEEAGCLAEMFAGGAAKSRKLAPLFRAVAERRGAVFLDAAPVIQVSPLDGHRRSIGAATRWGCGEDRRAGIGHRLFIPLHHSFQGYRAEKLI